YAIVDRSYIDGTLYYDRQAEERRLTQLKKEKDTLVMAERAERRSPATTDQNQDKPRMASPGGPSTSPGTGPSADDNASVGTAGTASALRAAAASLDRALRALQDARSRQAGGPVVAITNARIVPVTRPEIERGTIVIRGGRIDAVGADVQVPAGAKVIDAAGASVYPGWIDARSTLGLAEPGARGFADDQEMLDFNPQLRTQVAFHSDSEAIPIARANGVTSVAVTPAGGMLGGQVAVMNLNGWTWEENTVAPNVGIAFEFPAIGGGGRGGGGFGQNPDRTRQYDELKKERDARLEELVRLLDQARAYAKVPAASRTIDWTLDALVPVVERRAPLIARAEREQEIRDVVAFADRTNVKLVISGGLEAPIVAPLLKEKNIPVVLSSILTLPSREDMSHAASYQIAGELQRAGVLFAFSSGGNTNARLLPYNAALSVAWGLPRAEAIKALTINAAQILGVGDRLGSIEPGKIANLVVSKGDPLEIRTEITHVIINGQDVGLDNRHHALYERYMTRQ
ncbi:MAG: amidohydrolase family protein, partial [Acidobacteria bacterium]|nr:amidohydrolase family protein [Acidobacteriota bacterium]